jgi:hypothetical protein
VSVAVGRLGQLQAGPTAGQRGVCVSHSLYWERAADLP